MRAYRVNKFKHKVYDSIDETPSNITPLKNWRVAEVGDWVIADDECIIQILRKGKMLRKKSYQYYIGTCTGTFPVSKNTKMDTDRRPNIYSFSGYGTPEEVVANRRKMTANEELFVQYVTAGIQPEEAYVKAFPTNNKRYAKMKAANLVKTERIKTAMKEELKPILEEMGVDESFVLKGIKAEAEMADKSGDRLKALFKLADIFDMEDKNATKVQQITGVQFQGFADEMIEPTERKELTDGE